ncbi:2-amino-4-hydroxy-6-hydroxymethyldihydropteridine diphosphokinase [Ectothiorhodospiraceae bacterium BW-2]|nr:2-amino-4-hydroxy-6-hydroxymethyldihydropteridine diphosphokinase [Ectothiorhodospiraceae bacterium BW-2]
MATEQGYFIGIGSNIDPEKNIQRALTLLQQRFGTIELSPLQWTEPVGMTSRAPFINGVLYLESSSDSATLKQQLNQIEIELGRDRTDPERKIKDRPIDLDILLARPIGTAVTAADTPQESYLQRPFQQLIATLNPPPGTPFDPP